MTVHFPLTDCFQFPFRAASGLGVPIPCSARGAPHWWEGAGNGCPASGSPQICASMDDERMAENVLDERKLGRNDR